MTGGNALANLREKAARLVSKPILGDLTSRIPHSFLTGEPSIEEALVMLIDQVGDDGVYGLRHLLLPIRKAFRSVLQWQTKAACLDSPDFIGHYAGFTAVSR